MFELDVPTFSTVGDAKDMTSAEMRTSIEVNQQQQNGREEYDNYVSLIDDWVDDNQDPDFLAAIEASLVDQQTTASGDASLADEQTNEHQCVNAILKSFQAENLQNSDLDTSINIIISRKSVLATTLRAIERKKFSFFEPLIVTFAGEAAVDLGGPKREFFRLLMASLRESAVFYGSWFSHDLNLLRNSKYALAGKLIAWSVLQGGNGPRCLSEEGYNLLRGLVVDQASAIEAVADADMKQILQATAASASEEDFANIVTKHSDLIGQYGYSKIYTSKLANKDEMVDCLLKQNFIYGVHAEFTQFLGGMNSIGHFGDVTMANKSVFDAILGNKQDKLTLTAFKSLYEVVHSDKGSNSRNQEESTIYCFELFLQDLEEGEADGLTLEDLLIFTTGTGSAPPLGFDHLITVEFYDFVGNVRRRPWSSTCALSLNLPRGVEDPVEFNALMKESLLECHGFGTV